MQNIRGKVVILWSQQKLFWKKQKTLQCRVNNKDRKTSNKIFVHFKRKQIQAIRVLQIDIIVGQVRSTWTNNINQAQQTIRQRVKPIKDPTITKMKSRSMGKLMVLHLTRSYMTLYLILQLRITLRNKHNKAFQITKR